MLRAQYWGKILFFRFLFSHLSGGQSSAIVRRYWFLKRRHFPVLVCFFCLSKSTVQFGRRFTRKPSLLLVGVSAGLSFCFLVSNSTIIVYSAFLKRVERCRIVLFILVTLPFLHIGFVFQFEASFGTEIFKISEYTFLKFRAGFTKLP